MPKISFFETDTKVAHLNRVRLRRFLLQLFLEETRKDVNELVYVFCTDEYLLEINKQFLQHNYYTDIITFDLSSQSDLIAGDIYISIDRVRENATTYKYKEMEELHRVIFHGALHLCGYSDKTSAQKRRMRSKEEEYLVKYFDAGVFHVKQ